MNVIKKFEVVVEGEYVRVWRTDGQWIAVDDSGAVIGCHKMNAEEWGEEDGASEEELKVRRAVDRAIAEGIARGEGECDPVGPTQFMARALAKSWGWSL